MKPDPLLQTGPQRYQPVQNLLPEAMINQRRLAFFVGLVAIGLPSLLILAAAVLPGICLYDSLSHFYYAPLWGSVFVGALVFIGTYLLVWQGNCPGERHLASLAAPFAWGVALLPTSGAGCSDPRWSARVMADLRFDQGAGLTLEIPVDTSQLLELSGLASSLHYICGAILFAILAFFALKVFTRVVPDRDLDAEGALRAVKLRRNRIYRRCGWVIISCISLIGGASIWEWVTGSLPPFWNIWNLTLILEALALYAFGLCWMVKGRFLGAAFIDSPA